MEAQQFKNWFDGFNEALKLFGQDAPNKEQWEFVVARIGELNTTPLQQKELGYGRNIS